MPPEFQTLNYQLSEEGIATITLNRPQKLNAMNSQMRSDFLKLQNELISNLKFVAEHHGIGYQPLIRDLLHRFVRAEMRDIMYNMQEAQDDEETITDEDSPVAKFFIDKKLTA